MNSLSVWMPLCVALFGSTTAAFGQACQGGGNVNEQLEWCSRDHGFNEGAACGANALAGSGLAPSVAGGSVGGNIWDRTNMMGAARAAAKAGQIEPAVNAAI